MNENESLPQKQSYHWKEHVLLNAQNMKKCWYYERTLLTEVQKSPKADRKR